MGTTTTITLASGGLILGSTVAGVGKTVNITAGSATFGTSGGLWKGLVTGGAISGNNVGLDNAANTHTSTFVNTGTIRVGVPGSLGAGALSYTSNPNNHLRLVDATGGTYTNTFNMSSGANRQITVENAAAVINWTGTINGTSNMVTKFGDGTLAVSDWNVTSDVIVSAGTFLMNDTDTASQGDYTVNSGATLGGTGEIDLAGANTVTVDDGGTLAPGASPGTLSIIGGLVLNNASILAFELGTPGVIGSGVNDLVDVDGKPDTRRRTSGHRTGGLRQRRLSAVQLHTRPAYRQHSHHEFGPVLHRHIDRRPSEPIRRARAGHGAAVGPGGHRPRPAHPTALPTLASSTRHPKENQPCRNRTSRTNW